MGNMPLCAVFMIVGESAGIFVGTCFGIAFVGRQQKNGTVVGAEQNAGVASVGGDIEFGASGFRFENYGENKQHTSRCQSIERGFLPRSADEPDSGGNDG